MKFTRRMKFFTIAASAVVSIATASIVLAAEYSSNDPLISKSYLDQVFYNQIVSYVDTKIASVSGTSGISNEYQVITLYKGQTLYASSSLEFFLRPGAYAAVVSPIPENGIADLTTGAELYSGYAIPVNCYCVIPRGDGRGITCLSDIAYVMVRGDYEIR